MEGKLDKLIQRAVTRRLDRNRFPVIPLSQLAIDSKGRSFTGREEAWEEGAVAASLIMQ